MKRFSLWLLCRRFDPRIAAFRIFRIGGVVSRIGRSLDDEMDYDDDDDDVRF